MRICIPPSPPRRATADADAVMHSPIAAAAADAVMHSPIAAAADDAVMHSPIAAAPRRRRRRYD